ncbi:MAG TPA: MarR family winged helix-turn-helix transcriptional regulator [Gaiellaceae bacterium]|nr:MarR family winged helix-turn-helix transcriptional regulator [Gaiellaceae bacterium]
MTTPVSTSAPLVHRVAKEVAARPMFLLARLGFGIKSRLLDEAETAGFAMYDFSLLALVAEGRGEAQARIAEMLSVDPSRVVALLDSLEERGFVTRRRDPQDRRRHVVTITPAGTKELQRLRGIVKKLEAEFFAPLDADQLRTFHQLLLLLAAEHDPACAFYEPDA